MKKLIIDRTKWMRGGSDGGSCLRNEFGRMCCLGFFALECGQTKEEITLVTYPRENKTPKMPRWTFNMQGTIGEMLAIANDLSIGAEAKGIRFESEAEREKYIIDKFAEGGIQVEFIN